MSRQTMMDKAAALLREGRIREIGGHVYAVEGSAGDAYTTVVASDPVSGEQWLVCNCESHGFCYHGLTAQMLARKADASDRPRRVTVRSGAFDGKGGKATAGVGNWGVGERAYWVTFDGMDVDPMLFRESELEFHEPERPVEVLSDELLKIDAMLAVLRHWGSMGEDYTDGALRELAGELAAAYDTGI